MMDRAIWLSNKAVVAAIRKFSPNRNWHFQRWADLLSSRWSTRFGKTYFGAIINCDLSDFIDRRIFFFGIWEPNISAVFHAELKPGDFVADVGANIGYDTLLASKIVGGAGRVIAIEASPSIYQRLINNIEVNRRRNVRSVAVAVSDRAGELTLYSEQGNLGRTSSQQRGEAVETHTVQALPLDEILTAEELSRLKFIKVDIEGGEIAFLERLTATLDAYPPDLRLLVEMSEDESGRSKRAFDALKALGFRAYAVENDYAIQTYLAAPAIKRPREITSLPDTQMDVLFKR